MKLTYSEAEEVAYENGVLDALALVEEELRKTSFLMSDRFLAELKAEVFARLIGDTN